MLNSNKLQQIANVLMNSGYASVICYECGHCRVWIACTSSPPLPCSALTHQNNCMEILEITHKYSQTLASSFMS